MLNSDISINNQLELTGNKITEVFYIFIIKNQENRRLKNINDVKVLLEDTKFHKQYFVDPYINNGWIPQVFLHYFIVKMWF